ncbi:hypothetical protein CPTD_00052 [Corynebacterium pseudotuberculosis]|nr:hypothetical protein CPTD_00052 [Corynebacterium pseudotuberculosis]
MCAAPLFDAVLLIFVPNSYLVCTNEFSVEFSVMIKIYRV